MTLESDRWDPAVTDPRSVLRIEQESRRDSTREPLLAMSRFGDVVAPPPRRQQSSHRPVAAPLGVKESRGAAVRPS